MENLILIKNFNKNKELFILKNNFFRKKKFELNKLSDLLRLELAQSGYTETLTFTLVRIKIKNKIFTYS